jgi:hypothetical protein
VTEIYGDKEFVVLPPSDGQYLYPNPKVPNKSLIPDPLHLDRARFPRHEHATLYRAVLKPGDMVFIPCGWWHTARALSPSISVGMNIMDESNWDGFVAQVFGPSGRRPLTLRGLANWAYWNGIGRLLSALEKMQDHYPGIAHAVKVPELLAPASSQVAVDPATLHIRRDARED